MPKIQIATLISKKDIYSYLLQGLIILFSVLLSLYLENLNNEIRAINKKNNYLKDLITTLEEDVEQIQSLRSILNESVITINKLQDDIDSNNNITFKHPITVTQTLKSENLIS